MFDIGAIRVAYDKNTGEAQGIYALQIKPTPILTPLINASSQMIGLLHVKVFQYSHHSQKEHKRLLRYIDRQWKMRLRHKSKLTQPFKVSTLLKEMDIPVRYNWSDKKDKLENVLDDFKADGVIKDWNYTDVFDESIVGTKGWYNIWTNYSIIIYPTDDLREGYKKTMDLTSQAILEQTLLDKIQQKKNENALLKKVSNSGAHAETASSLDSKVLKFEQQTFDLDEKEEITLSPESMKEMINHLNISIRHAATEIGVAHTTLSRYLKRENKRQNSKNDEKMLNWLRMHSLTSSI
jgi:hypothetical protein